MYSKSTPIIVAILVIGIVIGYAIGGLTKSVTTITSTRYSTITTTALKSVTETVVYTKTATETLTYTTSVMRLYPITVVDALGRTIEIEHKPKRVVSLAPAITEIIFALNISKYLVAVDDCSNYPPEVQKLIKEKKLVVIHSYWNPDIEQIVKLKPDLVLADAGAHAKLLKKFVELQKSYGIKVVFLHGGAARSVEDVFSDIMIVAHIFRIDDVGAKLINSIRSKLNAIIEEIKSVNTTRRVLVLLGPPSWGLWVAGGGTFIDNIIEKLGLVNVFKKKYGWVQVSYEDILKANPDVIIVTAMWPPTRKAAIETLQQVMNNTYLSKLKAVKKGLVFAIYGPAQDALLRPGPRLWIAAAIIAHIVYPNIVEIPKSYQDYIISLAELRSSVKA